MQSKLMERLLSKIEKTDSCWIWKDRPSSRGYGRLNIHQRGSILAHRLSYELHIGEIPSGHVIHHQCGNQLCVNPAHLEPITQAEHILKEGHIKQKRLATTHCPKGHEYTLANTVIAKTKYGVGRNCKQCNADRWKRNYVPTPKVPKTHCPQGHAYDGENMSMKKDGYRYCLQCARDYYYRTKNKTTDHATKKFISRTTNTPICKDYGSNA
jgi:hypothetical protein